MPSKNKGRRPVASRGKSLLTPEATEPAFSITKLAKLATGKAFSTLLPIVRNSDLPPSAALP